MQDISFSDILNSDVPRAEKARFIAQQIRATRKYSWVGIYDVRDKEIALIACAGRSEPVFTSFPKDKGLNGRAVGRRQTIIVNDTDMDEDYLLTFSDTQAEIIVPVFGANGGDIVGTIDAESEEKNAFGDEDAVFLEECAKAIQSLWSR